MSFFEKIIQQIFGNHKVNSTVPLIEEEIKRSEFYRSAYFRWVNDKNYRWLLQKIKESYELKKQGEIADLQVHILNSTGAKGLAITYSPLMNEQDLQFLFDYLKDRLLNLEYRLYTSDRRTFDHTDYVESIEKHYLKPKSDKTHKNISTNAKEMFDQRYGNILIEYISIDAKPSFLRFMTQYYSDFLYTPVQPFDDLIDILFD
ncbi:MAG: hypothetical protein MUE81_13665 [Thermoflexibacter sp.]|jgi:hypothetical protein|nr:hypothetical protein [Thermoflexibacter sp.]